MAVPAPSAIAPSAQVAKPLVAAIQPMAPAWVSIPATMSGLRPMRSDSPPV